jgi:hypothetical protein
MWVMAEVPVRQACQYQKVAYVVFKNEPVQQFPDGV